MTPRAIDQLLMIAIALLIVVVGLIVVASDPRPSPCQTAPGGIFRTLNCGETK